MRCNPKFHQHSANITLETNYKRIIRVDLPSAIHLLYAFGAIFPVFEFHQYDTLWMIFTNLHEEIC
jgi:hypothetical protein